MSLETDEFPPEQKLALAHSSGAHQRRLQVFLALDGRLAHFVSQSKETMLTQMRIAWWRDQFGKPVADRPTGDPVLDAVSVDWVGEEDALTALVNGWEALLAEPPLPDEAALEFVTGRAQCFAAMARLQQEDPVNAMHCGVLWAFGDLASKISDAEERAMIAQLADEQCAGPLTVPYRLRSLRILGSLGQRALKNGATSLVSGRADILHISRLGLFGR